MQIATECKQDFSKNWYEYIYDMMLQRRTYHSQLIDYQHNILLQYPSKEAQKRMITPYAKGSIYLTIIIGVIFEYPFDVLNLANIDLPEGRWDTNLLKKYLLITNFFYHFFSQRGTTTGVSRRIPDYFTPLTSNQMLIILAIFLVNSKRIQATT